MTVKFYSPKNGNSIEFMPDYESEKISIFVEIDSSPPECIELSKGDLEEMKVAINDMLYKFQKDE